MTSEYAYQVGALLRWALDRKKSVATSEEYARLLALYYSKHDFREMVDQVAEGLGLQVIPMRTGDAQDRQLVIGAMPDSPFARSTTPNSLRSAPNTTADARILTGLIHVGIAVAFYPEQRDLHRPLHERGHYIIHNDVHELLHHACKQLVDQETDGGDDVATIPVAAKLYLELEAAATTKGGEYTRDSALGRIETILNSYVTDGLATVEEVRAPKPDAPNIKRYYPTFYYQAHLQEFAAHRGFQMVQAAREQHGAS